MEEIIRLRAQIDATSIMTRGGVSREVQPFIVGGTFEETEARGYILRYGTAAEKRDLFEQEKFAEDEKLEAAMQAASSAIDPPIPEEIAEGEPIEGLEKDVADRESEPGMTEKDPPEPEPQKIP